MSATLNSLMYNAIARLTVASDGHKRAIERLNTEKANEQYHRANVNEAQKEIDDLVKTIKKSPNAGTKWHIKELTGNIQTSIDGQN